MPTVSSHRRKKAQLKPAAPAQPPTVAPPPELEELPRDLRLSRELAFCTCMGLRMETWLAHHIADRGIPADECAVAITLLPIYVEAWLKACVLFPEFLPAADPDEDDEAQRGGTISASDARRAGLTIVRKRPGKHQPVPTLPGCRGIVNGLECGELRRPGQRLCPACMKAERERARGEG